MFYHWLDFDSVFVSAGLLPTFLIALKVPLLVRDCTLKILEEMKLRDFFHAVYENSIQTHT